jgi:hypothetical protein
LPPKPVLRLVESPERRGIYGELKLPAFLLGFYPTNVSSDAFDSGSAKLDCSILQPSTPYIASPTSIRSDGTSFYLTSSLDSAVFDSPELEVGTAVQFLKVSGTELTTIVKNSGRLRSDESGSPLKITEPRNITRRLPTIGQITAFRNGSLVSRHLPNSKFSSRQGVCSSPYGSLKRVQQLKATLKQDVKVMDDVFRVVSASCSDSGSPQRLDSLTRRSMYYDVGPKIRYAKDAHEVIMGDQSA